MAIARSAGPWRTEQNTFVTPSQDWLFRAWRSGVPVITSLDVSVIAIITGGRKAFYKEKRDAEHAYVFENYTRSREAFSALEKVAIADQPERRRPLGKRIIESVYERLVGRLLVLLGIHPNTLRMIIRHGGRGRFVKRWRKRASLE